MKIQNAINKARLDAISENYERLKQREDWATLSKDEKFAHMTIECGVSRQALTPYLKEMGIEL